MQAHQGITYITLTYYCQPATAGFEQPVKMKNASACGRIYYFHGRQNQYDIDVRNEFAVDDIKNSGSVTDSERFFTACYHMTFINHFSVYEYIASIHWNVVIHITLFIIIKLQSNYKKYNLTETGRVMILQARLCHWCSFTLDFQLIPFCYKIYRVVTKSRWTLMVSGMI